MSLRSFFYRFITITFILILLAGAGLWGFSTGYVHAPGSLGESRQVFIPKGSSLHTIAARLEEEKVIRFPLLFRLMYYIATDRKPLQAGEYAFHAGITPYETLQKMQDGQIVYRKLTIPEGLTSSQIRQLIDHTEGLTGTLPSHIPEGTLLPETYFFQYQDSKASLLEHMRQKQKAMLDSLWEQHQISRDVITNKKDWVTLASIVEKETGVRSERARVAGVFLNRLRQHMRLQSDPTVIYAVTQGRQAMDRPLSKADLATVSPFNTYTSDGLPPTPICHPGTAALQAVIQPETTKALYFVADGEGGHRFANTLGDHNRNVRDYRKQQKAHTPVTGE